MRWWKYPFAHIAVSRGHDPVAVAVLRRGPMPWDPRNRPSSSAAAECTSRRTGLPHHPFAGVNLVVSPLRVYHPCQLRSPRPLCAGLQWARRIAAAIRPSRRANRLQLTVADWARVRGAAVIGRVSSCAQLERRVLRRPAERARDSALIAHSHCAAVLLPLAVGCGRPLRYRPPLIFAIPSPAHRTSPPHRHEPTRALKTCR